MKKEIKNKWACVFWLDAYSYDSWQETRDIKKWAENSFKDVNRTFGEVIEETKDYIVIAASFSQNKNLVGDVMMIPKVLIKKIDIWKNNPPQE